MLRRRQRRKRRGLCRPELQILRQRLDEMLYVDPRFRRQGIGSALIRHLINECRTPKLFTSTNQSNFPMQRLLATLEFDRSGFIENLDEGDPEWVYFKRLRNNAT